MKIGIDGTPLTIPFPYGVKNYSNQLITSISKLDKNNEYTIFASKKISVPNQSNFRLKIIPNFFPVLKKQFFLAFFAKKEKLDVFHYLEPYGAIFFSYPRIVTTIHDVNLTRNYPTFSKYILNRIYCEIARLAVSKHTKIFITPSNSIKKELRLYLNSINKHAKISVIPEGLDKSFKVLKNRNASKKNFILSMGDFSPRKNVPGVLKAYSRLPKDLRKKINLKIVASTQEPVRIFEKKAKDLKVDSTTKILVNVSKSKLIDLYNNAYCFLYPSFYEGFGLPIIEAMACGCPVITSNYGAMKETAGNAAFLVNPVNASEIKNSMIQIIKSKSLRKKLRILGLKRASEFSWLNTAKQTLKIYERVYRQTS